MRACLPATRHPERGFSGSSRARTAPEHTYEIDEFFGENEGLIVAEIELSHEQESFEKPHYLGEEVTGDEKYYNSSLSKEPFKYWA